MNTPTHTGTTIMSILNVLQDLPFSKETKIDAIAVLFTELVNAGAVKFNRSLRSSATDFLDRASSLTESCNSFAKHPEFIACSKFISKELF